MNNLRSQSASKPNRLVGRGLCLAVGFSTCPWVFVASYNSQYLLNLNISPAALGLAGIGTSLLFGLVAARLAQVLSRTIIVGLLAGGSLGLCGIPFLFTSDAALVMIALASLFGSVGGGFVGLAVKNLERRRSEAPWLGYSALGFAVGGTTGLYLDDYNSIVLRPVTSPLVGALVGTGIGLAAWRHRHTRPWLGKVGLGTAVGCSVGIWAYDIGISRGLGGGWAVEVLWPALGGAVGLAWAGRSGPTRLRTAAAGLAVGAYTGAYAGVFGCLSTDCIAGTSGPDLWGLVGALVGSCLGVIIGLGGRTHYGLAGLGGAVGALIGHSAFNNSIYYQGSLGRPQLIGPVTVGIFGLLTGWRLGSDSKRKAAWGCLIGGCAGAWAGGEVAYYAVKSFDAARGGIVGMVAGGLIGWVISTKAWSPRLNPPILGLTVGAFVGTRFGDLGGTSGPHAFLGMTIGAVLGVVASLRSGTVLRRSLPGLAMGAFIGAWIGADFADDFSAPYSTSVMSLIGMVAGGLFGFLACGHPVAIASISAVRQLNTAQFRDVPPARVANLSLWLVTLAAVIAAPEPLRKRYAEEFDSTVMAITGPFASLRRLFCAASLLIHAPAIRTEVGDDD